MTFLEHLLYKAKQRVANTPEAKVKRALQWIDHRMEMFRDIEAMAEVKTSAPLRAACAARLSELADVRSKLV